MLEILNHIGDDAIKDLRFSAERTRLYKFAYIDDKTFLSLVDMDYLSTFIAKRGCSLIHEFYPELLYDAPTEPLIPGIIEEALGTKYCDKKLEIKTNIKFKALVDEYLDSILGINKIS